MHAPRHSPLAAFLVGTLGIALFSIMDAVMKGLVLAIGTYATLLWRSFVGVGLAGTLYGTLRSPWPARATMRLHVGRGVLTTLMGLLFFWGLGRVPLAQAIALAFIAPLIALYLASIWLHEKVGPRTVGASLLAFAGVVVIFIGQAQADLGREALLGSLAVLASAVCYAVNIILMRRQSLAAGPVEIAFYQNLTVAAVLLAAFPLVGAAPPPAAQWPWITLAALLSTLSLLLLSWAYARAEASYLSATEYTSFLWAAMFGWTIFGETLSPFTLAGAVLIVIGCVLAARKPEEASPALEASV
ncbi:DMT family transporter [Sphingomonas sp. GCM10030256]|uniref:DMT family transporter n=1 Tax=Sphingomonas sp. GCM10030256 TaxID=3273427 RepID=UPI0036118E17